jgi:hypothetical protein
MTFPNRCRVNACERPHNNSRNSLAAGEIIKAKSDRVSAGRLMISRVAAAEA